MSTRSRAVGGRRIVATLDAGHACKMKGSHAVPAAYTHTLVAQLAFRPRFRVLPPFLTFSERLGTRGRVLRAQFPECAGTEGIKDTNTHLHGEGLKTYETEVFDQGAYLHVQCRVSRRLLRE